MLKNIDFNVSAGEIVSILGPSGCGKTTLLRMIAGLDNDFDGEIVAENGATGTKVACGLVFQDARLLPWYTVAQNIAFGISDDLSSNSKDQLLQHTLRLTNLVPSRNYLPHQLSGGMQKLTAIGRAIVSEPEIMLLDEPFSSLDPPARVALHDTVLRIQQNKGFSIILVTHDVDEAVYLSDRIMVLGDRPTTLLETVAIDDPRPREHFTAAHNNVRRRLWNFLPHTESVI